MIFHQYFFSYFRFTCFVQYLIYWNFTLFICMSACLFCLLACFEYCFQLWYFLSASGEEVALQPLLYEGYIYIYLMRSYRDHSLKRRSPAEDVVIPQATEVTPGSIRLHFNTTCFTKACDYNLSYFPLLFL